MKKFKHLKKVKEIYSRGENIIQYLTDLNGQDENTIEDIIISYDFQSGSYIKALSKHTKFNQSYCGSIASILNQFSGIESLMEVGVGEATTLSTVVKNMSNRPQNILGFDISWSRLKFAKHFLQDVGLKNVSLFSGNLFEIPLQDNSVDIVYTSHSIEPNGGKERQAIEELFRITKKYLILLEPGYEFADEAGRARMRKLGYVTKLKDTISDLGLNVIEHRLFDHSVNPLNPTSLFIIQKEGNSQNNCELVCPITKTKLRSYNDSLLYSPEGLAYPVIDGIPCLLSENAILATHLLTSYDSFKKENGIDLSDYVSENPN
ncbi:MAG: hypothetical protein ACI865_002121 [Flavobacteriaceae bacterium]|jgi:hypothetical protein